MLKRILEMAPSVDIESIGSPDHCCAFVQGMLGISLATLGAKAAMSWPMHHSDGSVSSTAKIMGCVVAGSLAIAGAYSLGGHLCRKVWLFKIVDLKVS